MLVTLRFQTTGVVPGNARPVVMQGGALTIGRAGENDLVLPDPDRQISKHHCAIEDRGGDIVVIDFSSNGTFLNYGKLPLGRVPTPLSDGDILTMGAFELLVSIAPGDAPARRDQIADPLPDPLAGASGRDMAILPPLDDLHAPQQGDMGLPEDAGEIDFLDSLLGPSVPRGPSGVDRPQLGDDGLLPPLGADDIGLPPEPTPSGAASQYERQQQVHDHFAAPQAGNYVPDDWDDLLDGIAPPEPHTPGPPPAEDFADPIPAPDQPPAFAHPAPDQPPVASPPVAPPVPGGDGGDAIGAFLAGLGAADLQIGPQALPATMERLGRTLRSMIVGLREVLMTRASIKQEFLIGQTVISSAGNNPLKFSVSPEQAIEAMLRPGQPGWLSPDAAAEQALRDIKAHEVAMMTGMAAALKDLLARLDPAVLETRLEAKGGLGGFLKGKKARYWELYETLYTEIADQAENEFQELFAREFARAYREQLERLK